MKDNYFYNKDEILKPLQNSGNNKVFKLLTDDNLFLLKKYNVDEDERLHREIVFYKFAKKNNINNVPLLVNYSLKNKFIVTTFIDGQTKVAKPLVNSDLIKQYAVFINELNKNSKLINSYKLMASDSFVSIDLFIKLIDERLISYKSYLNNYSSSIKNLFINLERYFFKIKNDLSNKSINICNKQILSPSDVGFHNTLLEGNNLTFYDFEYSGLDNPLKLVSDFFLQPRYNINKKNIDIFIDALDCTDDDFKEIFILVLPLFVIKWILIFFNFLDPRNAKKFNDMTMGNVIKSRTRLIQKYFNHIESNYEIY